MLPVYLNANVGIAYQKLASILDSPTPISVMKVKQVESVIWLFLKTNLLTIISMKRSRRELSIDMVIHRSIFKNNLITLFLCFTYLKQG